MDLRAKRSIQLKYYELCVLAQIQVSELTYPNIKNLVNCYYFIVYCFRMFISLNTELSAALIN